MGNQVTRVIDCDHHNGFVEGEPITHSRDIDDHPGLGQTYVLISANNYPGSECELSGCSEDGRHIRNLLEVCQVPESNVTTILDEDNTVDNVRSGLLSTMAKCGPQDTFLFYYSGHGMNVADADGDEADGQDEALYLNGGWIVDDDLSDMLLRGLHPDANLIVILDCCHSATMLDFDHNPAWQGRSAVSISGCGDAQESTDEPSGGVLTGSILRALADGDMDESSVACVFNRALEKKAEYYGDATQDIKCHWAPGHGPERHPWPLDTNGEYTFKQGVMDKIFEALS